MQELISCTLNVEGKSVKVIGNGTVDIKDYVDFEY